jgi:hypothetical protein
MSAGKGDTPRKVNGDKFRANYLRIFSAQPPANDAKSAAKDSKTPRKSG